MTANKDQFKPLSPHLQIYRLPMTAVMSILHRVTGLLLFFYLATLSWIVILYNLTALNIDCCVNLLHGKPGLFFLTPMIFAVFYHMFNGIKYLGWSVGVGYDTQSINRFNLTVLFATFLCAAVAVLYIYNIVN